MAAEKSDVIPPNINPAHNKAYAEMQITVVDDKKNILKFEFKTRELVNHSLKRISNSDDEEVWQETSEWDVNTYTFTLQPGDDGSGFNYTNSKVRHEYGFEKLTTETKNTIGYGSGDIEKTTHKTLEHSYREVTDERLDDSKLYYLHGGDWTKRSMHQFKSILQIHPDWNHFNADYSINNGGSAVLGTSAIIGGLLGKISPPVAVATGAASVMVPVVNMVNNKRDFTGESERILWK